jgi:hypothetical protein
MHTGGDFSFDDGDSGPTYATSIRSIDVAPITKVPLLRRILLGYELSRLVYE